MKKITLLLLLLCTFGIVKASQIDSATLKKIEVSIVAQEGLLKNVEKMQVDIKNLGEKNECIYRKYLSHTYKYAGC